jgi:hypothetical protein
MAATAGALDNARKMAHALLGRGLQLQARGDPGEFITAFRTSLVLSRTLRNGGGLAALETGLEVERIALQGADRWLERLPAGHADLTRALAQAAGQTDDATPFELRPHLLADRFIVRGMMDAPNQWLPLILTPPGWQREQTAAEADLVAFAWAVAWERERTRRLVGRFPDDLRPDSAGLLAGRPGSPLLLGRSRTGTEMAEREAIIRVLRRAAILKAAVRAFQADHGTPPREQMELVSRGYLARLPEDPFADARPLGYRVSAGETLRGPPRSSGGGRPIEQAYLVPVAPGQVIVWSVGVDRADQGGLVPPAGPRAEDLVFLVPLPAVPAP